MSLQRATVMGTACMTISVQYKTENKFDNKNYQITDMLWNAYPTRKMNIEIMLCSETSVNKMPTSNIHEIIITGGCMCRSVQLLYIVMYHFM